METFDGKLVLVTGGSGFVGSHFVRRLLELGARVRIPIHLRPPPFEDSRIEIVHANLTRPEDCLHACEGVDCVIHAAGGVGAAGITQTDAKVGSIVLNLNLSALMLQAASGAGVNRFLLFSSSTGYSSAQHPVREDEFWAGEPHPVYFGYGWMRRYLERLGEFIHQTTSTRVAIVRPSAIYGERDNFDPATCHVVSALIRRAVEREAPFTVWGGPEVVRDFLYVGDLVEGSLLALERYSAGDPINIGYGQAITIGEIASRILNIAGHDTEILYDRSKPTTLPFRAVDISKARQLLGFEPIVPLQQGLTRTVEWYRSIN